MTKLNCQLRDCNYSIIFSQNNDLRRQLSSMESELMVLQHSVSHKLDMNYFVTCLHPCQLKTHQEDFEQERRDRVRIHEEKERLQQELESQAQVIKMLVCTTNSL